MNESSKDDAERVSGSGKNADDEAGIIENSVRPMDGLIWAVEAIDPAGSARPVKDGLLKSLGLTGMGVCSLASAGFLFLLLSGGFGATAGGTRSSRIKWEARRVEVLSEVEMEAKIRMEKGKEIAGNRAEGDEFREGDQ